MNGADIVARLEGVIDRGSNSWYSRCPAHDDKSPSLSIRDTGDRILIHCFAGCSPDDILAAVGLTFRDLYRDEWKAAREQAVSGAGRDYARKHKFDPLDYERIILETAQADIAAGKELSVEDQARVQLAVLRLKETA
jgi:putative DNA primase/helicase